MVSLAMMSQSTKKPLDYDRPDFPLRIFLTAAKMVLNSRPGRKLLNLIKRHLEPEDGSWFEVTELPLQMPNLAAEFNHYRLVQISDFHYGTWLNEPLLSEAVERVNQLHPDLVAITGDFVTRDPDEHAPALVRCLSRLSAADGIVAILGNHDHWSDPIAVRRILQQAGIRDLSNTILSLKRGENYLHIAGVDDYVEHLDNLESVLSQLPAQGAAVLLAHEPDYALQSSKTGRFDLQLSGHTHGGQVRLPWVGALILPQYGKKFSCGLYRVGAMNLYTNRGLGMAELDIRYHCPAEISVFILESPIRP